MRKRQQARQIVKLLVGVILLVVAFIGLAYGSLLREMGRAAEQYRQGDLEAALARYESVEQELRSLGALRAIPARDRQNLFLNEARLLYALGKYDEAAERLDRENELAGQTTDGRFFLLRGNITFRKAVVNYQASPTKDLRLLEEALLAAEDSLRESLRLNPNDWDAKFNYEFLIEVRKLLKGDEHGQMRILMENVRVKEMQPQPLSPEQQH